MKKPKYVQPPKKKKKKSFQIFTKAILVHWAMNHVQSCWHTQAQNIASKIKMLYSNDVHGMTASITNWNGVRNWSHGQNSKHYMHEHAHQRTHTHLNMHTVTGSKYQTYAVQSHIQPDISAWGTDSHEALHTAGGSWESMPLTSKN